MQFLLEIFGLHHTNKMSVQSFKFVTIFLFLLPEVVLSVPFASKSLFILQPKIRFITFKNRIFNTLFIFQIDWTLVQMPTQFQQLHQIFQVEKWQWMLFQVHFSKTLLHHYRLILVSKNKFKSVFAFFKGLLILNFFLYFRVGWTRSW